MDNQGRPSLSCLRRHDDHPSQHPDGQAQHAALHGAQQHAFPQPDEQLRAHQDQALKPDRDRANQITIVLNGNELIGIPFDLAIILSHMKAIELDKLKIVDNSGAAATRAHMSRSASFSVPRGLVSQMRRGGLSGEKASVKSMSWENVFQPLNPYPWGSIRSQNISPAGRSSLVACGVRFRRETFVLGETPRRDTDPAA